MANILYVGVARVPDRCPIAECAAVDSREEPKSRFDDKLAKLLTSGRIEEYKRLTITDKDVGNIHYDSDPAFLFMAVTVPDYPQRTAFRFLSEVRAVFEQEFADEMSVTKASGLSRSAKPLLSELLTKYQDAAKADKIANVTLQVEQVKGVMQSNIQAALQNQDNLETLLDSSDNMRNEATSFNRSTNRVKKRMCWKNAKMTLGIAFLVIILVIVIAVPWAVKSKSAGPEQT